MLSWLKMAPLSGFKTASSSNDMRTTRFNPNDEAQRAYIEDELSLFKRSFDSLLAIDEKLGMGLGIDTLLWFGGLVGPALGMVGLGALYFFATQYAMREEHSNSFQKQLTELKKTYRWIAKESPRITHDATFLKVLEALVPFVEKEDLLLWNFNQTDPREISDRFTEILYRSPHRIQFVMVKAGSHSFEDTKKSVLQNKWMGLFEQTLSELKRVAYGQPVKEANQPLNTLTK